MRKSGYRFQGKNEKGEEMSFVYPLSRNGYPRFHIYLKANEKEKQIFLNLHLDQKKPIYKGASAHNADYDGNAVESEAERIKQILQEN